MKSLTGRSIITYLLVLFLAQACSSTKVYYASEDRYKPTRSVEILSQAPKQPYVVIATLEARAPAYENGEFVFEKMRSKARKIGAHAIIPFEYHNIPNYSSAPLKPNYTPPRKPGEVHTSRILQRQPKSWGKALAIRYLETDKNNEEQEKVKDEKTDSNDHSIPGL
ncbi:MAG: hypothetical protein R3222_06125 [Balneolaceae bacterium]|nr:hypothetical protein [Balneolaceae bacterium]